MRDIFLWLFLSAFCDITKNISFSSCRFIHLVNVAHWMQDCSATKEIHFSWNCAATAKAKDIKHNLIYWTFIFVICDVDKYESCCSKVRQPFHTSCDLLIFYQRFNLCNWFSSALRSYIGFLAARFDRADMKIIMSSIFDVALNWFYWTILKLVICFIERSGDFDVAKRKFAFAYETMHDWHPT